MSERATASGGTMTEAGLTLGQRLRGRLFVAVSWLAARLPEAILVRLAELAGDLWYRFTPERRAVGRANLGRVAAALAATGRASPGVAAAATSPAALERLVRSAYRHAARYYLEMIRTPAMTPAFLAERLDVETPEVVEEAFAPGTPVVFVGLHFGAIELPALYLTHRTGRTVVGPMETLDDPALQAWIVRSRGAAGVRLVDIRAARRELAAAIERGESVGLVGDRDILGSGVEMPFFGTPARFPIGPALLAVETGAPIYVASVRRAGHGRYRGRLAAAPVPVEGSRRERAMGALAATVAAFEDAIAHAPDQWWGAFFPIWSQPGGGTDPARAGEGGR